MTSESIGKENERREVEGRLRQDWAQQISIFWIFLEAEAATPLSVHSIRPLLTRGTMVGGLALPYNSEQENGQQLMRGKNAETEGMKVKMVTTASANLIDGSKPFLPRFRVVIWCWEVDSRVGQSRF
jgi:hypothetical protein